MRRDDQQGQPMRAPSSEGTRRGSHALPVPRVESAQRARPAGMARSAWPGVPRLPPTCASGGRPDGGPHRPHRGRRASARPRQSDGALPVVQREQGIDARADPAGERTGGHPGEVSRMTDYAVGRCIASLGARVASAAIFAALPALTCEYRTGVGYPHGRLALLRTRPTLFARRIETPSPSGRRLCTRTMHSW